jgi:hypothetical protein
MSQGLENSPIRAARKIEMFSMPPSAHFGGVFCTASDRHPTRSLPQGGRGRQASAGAAARLSVNWSPTGFCIAGRQAEAQTAGQERREGRADREENSR